MKIYFSSYKLGKKETEVGIGINSYKFLRYTRTCFELSLFKIILIINVETDIV